jgi:hypothetical protein
MELSCRKNARVFDTRLPGSSALGKVIKYGFSADGDSGKLIGTVTIGCAIGFGGAVSVSPGSPTYVSDDYVDIEYQFYADQIEVLPASDIGYTIPIDAANDDRRIPSDNSPVPGRAAVLLGPPVGRRLRGHPSTSAILTVRRLPRPQSTRSLRQ